MLPLETTQASQNMKCFTHALGTKENPTQPDYQKRKHAVVPPYDRLPARQEAFGREPKSVNAAPDHKSPVRTVPQPTQQHCHHQVLIGAQRSFTVSAQRNVEII